MSDHAVASAQCCVDVGILDALHRVQESLDAAAAGAHGDPDAVLDDILAARLLVGTVLLRLDGQAGG
jgi:hypothetical protein